MKFIDKKAPRKPEDVKLSPIGGYVCITWQEPKAKKEMDKAKQYVVYRFSPKEKSIPISLKI